MSAVRDALAKLAEWGGMIPAGKLLEVVEQAVAEQEPDRIYTTGQAAATFGLSPDYWQDRARAGAIEGAWQDGGPWYLPDRGIRVYLARKQIRATATRTKRRGPYKERKTA